MSNFIIVTGRSGAGISSSSKVLEDIGYEVFDNFPLSLVEALLAQHQKGKGSKIAIGIDVRARQFDAQAILEIKNKHDACLAFVTCDRDVLEKRFSETRRPHPLAKDRPIGIGIDEESKLLGFLQDSANLLVDTTALSTHDLKKFLTDHFDQANDKALTVTLLSFGFKYGPPRVADIIMDVRFLRNPHWDETLKPLTGTDLEVGTYIREDSAFEGFLEKFKALLAETLPHYKAEGKAYLTIAIGCTGGRHRSVFTAETLRPWLKELGLSVHVEHRDIEK